jgi:hypothetical protein
MKNSGHIPSPSPPTLHTYVSNHTFTYAHGSGRGGRLLPSDKCGRDRVLLMLVCASLMRASLHTQKITSLPILHKLQRGK